MTTLQLFGQGLFIAGLAGLIGAQFWVIYRAFQKSFGWGLIVFLVPLMPLVFVGINFGRMKRQAAALALGLFVLGAGAWVRRYAEVDREIQELRDLGLR